jgi:hypothetical protein
VLLGGCRVHTISVDGKLTAGDNKLKIVIKPALDATVERKKNHPYTVNTLAVSPGRTQSG